jgi:hypothetical protein
VRVPGVSLLCGIISYFLLLLYLLFHNFLSFCNIFYVSGTFCNFFLLSNFLYFDKEFIFFLKFLLPNTKLLFFLKPFVTCLVLFNVYSFIACSFLPNFTACWLCSWSLLFVLRK